MEKRGETLLNEFELKIDKKGLSSVLTTLIIILLSLVAIGIVWVIISNIISNSSGEIGIEKFSIDINFIKASINGDNVKMTVKRAVGIGNVSGVKFIISDGSESEDFTITQSLVELQEKTFTVILESLSPAEIKTASVAPIYIGSNRKEKLGDITDTYNFKSGDIINNQTDNETEERICIPECTGTDNCVNGMCISEGCTETRTDIEICTDGGIECGNTQDACGDFVNCDVSIGGCTTEQICNNGMCVSEGCIETRTDIEVCNDENALCGEVRDVCGDFVDCDMAVGGCSAKERCTSGNICEDLPFITGTIYSVWPTDINIYFDSEDLSRNELDFVYVVKFLPPSKESECLLIEDYSLPRPPQTRVIIKLLATQTDIAPGDLIEIWPSYEACMA
jgi:hypothetical protein